MPRLIVVLLVLVACGSEVKRAPVAPVAAPLSVSGHVRGADGVPVAGARITLLARVVEGSAVSDATGAFRLDVPRPGTWHISAHAAGHTGGFVEGVKVRGAATPADIVLGQGGVEVTVRVTHDAPLPEDAAIVIARESDAHGDAWLVPIERGTARVRLAPAKRYFVDAMAPLSGSVELTQPDGTLAIHVPQPPSDAVVAYVRSHGVPIGTVEPGTRDFADLAGFGEIVGDVPVVGIGEATHGTREMFQLKHRLFAYLAAEKGFTTLAFEADQAECRAIDAFVQGTAPAGVTARQVVSAIALPVWRTEEVVALVQWMRDYNATAKVRVHFVGFDMQSWKPARASLERADPAAAAALAKTTAKLDAGEAFSALTVAEQAAIEAALANAARIARDPIARRDVASLQQWVAYQRSPTDAVRDRMMADNLIALRGGGKLMIWAHNYHVGRYAETTSMGTHLSKAWGKDYLPFGVLFGEGAFIARTFEDLGDEDSRYTALVEQTIEAAPPTDAAAPFMRAGVPILALDLRALSGDVAAWFEAAHPTRELGWLFGSERSLARMGVLTERFDAAIFVARSTSTRMLPP